MSWEIKKHTIAKHLVLKSYLGAWFPIMAFRNPKIIYIDGFAGPGRYTNGEPGSPIYALEIAHEIYQKHIDKLRGKEFIFFFIESKKKNYDSLVEEINKLQLPKCFKIQVLHNEFKEVMKPLFAYLDDKSQRLAPTFAFIDPFGTKGVPFEIVKKIMSYEKCEVFFNHMYSGVLRSRDVSDHTELYGTKEWREYASDSDALTKLYSDQLENVANVNYTRRFNVRTKNNAPIFDLVYATNNRVGLDKMKIAMWKADPFGNYRFRDTTNPNQIAFFEPEPDLTPLKNLLVNKFKGQTVYINTIEDYVLFETPYLSSHIKKKTLTPLLKKGEIIVKRPPGSKSGYKEGTAIHFN